MSRFTVGVNYSYRQYDEDELTVTARSAEDITDAMVAEAFRLKHPSIDSELEIEDWAVDE